MSISQLPIPSQVFSNVCCPVDISRLLTFSKIIREWFSSFTVVMSSPKSILARLSSFVQVKSRRLEIKGKWCYGIGLFHYL